MDLPISKEIITYHNGTIWAFSKEGKGSTFSFYLHVEGCNLVISSSRKAGEWTLPAHPDWSEDFYVS